MMAITHKGRWAIGAAATSAALAAVLAVPIAVESTGDTAQAATSTTLATFRTAGAYKWTVPPGRTTVTFTVFGAAGGPAADGNILLTAGGAGGEARGQFTVRPGSVFEVVVGSSGSVNGDAGMPGGGWGASGNVPSGGGGGGDSDVRTGGQGNSCAALKSCELEVRIVVGGGGGGGGWSAPGGKGGGVQGVDGGGSIAASGGGQVGISTGCLLLNYWGSFGCGSSVRDTPVGAGGGGWYGGAADVTAGAHGGGGGGGSGYVSGLALTGSFPGGTHLGDGLVVISTP